VCIGVKIEDLRLEIADLELATLRQVYGLRGAGGLCRANEDRMKFSEGCLKRVKCGGEMQTPEAFIRECYALARSAMRKGNHPFGALLMHNGVSLLRAENTVHTERDVTRHAELNLVSQAARLLSAEVLQAGTLYTSTEPCAMCCGAIYWAGIGEVVFGCSAEALGRVAGDDFLIPSRELLARGQRPVRVVGPVLEEEGLAIHAAYW
jgi:tRNA(Arg) A34 adenosine deaminase TadA